MNTDPLETITISALDDFLLYFGADIQLLNNRISRVESLLDEGYVQVRKNGSAKPKPDFHTLLGILGLSFTETLTHTILIKAFNAYLNKHRCLNFSTMFINPTEELANWYGRKERDHYSMYLKRISETVIPMIRYNESLD